MIIDARNNLHLLNKLPHLRYLKQSECVTDNEGRTLVHLEAINNFNAVEKAAKAINNYYFHTLDNPSHRSKHFWENMVEHFGAYTLYTTLPYASSDIASSHNVNHQGCVNNLLQDLLPLSGCVNKFFEDYYEELYTKLKGLSWGPFAPRSFGVFPMIAINYNVISDFHWDEHDEPNSLCCLVALGDFTGGELYFPQLDIVVPLRPGQLVVFSSRLLLHGNFPVTRGIRHSIVYFVHSGFFHHLRDFSSVEEEFKTELCTGITIRRQNLNNANDALYPSKWDSFDKPKPIQINIPPKSSDMRRNGRTECK